MQKKKKNQNQIIKQKINHKKKINVLVDNYVYEVLIYYIIKFYIKLDPVSRP